MIRWFKDNFKNLGGWRTARKLVVFNVDDYGNVRIPSRQARDRLTTAGVKLTGRMDQLDTLETRQDLEALFEVLDFFKDHQGRPAKFTPYTLSANPDFARIQSDKKYHWELLPITFQRLAETQPTAYQGAWDLWQEGIAQGLMQPQFHGREHLNLTLIQHKLDQAANDLSQNLQNESMAGIESDLPGIGFTQAFALTPQKPIDEQLAIHREVITSGMATFEQVFGFRSLTFTPPSQVIHPTLYQVAEDLEIRGIDKPYRVLRDLGDGKRFIEKNRLGRQRSQQHITIVRNVVFEPAEVASFDPVQRALQLMEAAFRWGKPAIISSHRVNFCGHIDPEYRATGLANLKRLLDGMLQRWPDIEFISADQLVQIIDDSTP